MEKTPKKDCLHKWYVLSEWLHAPAFGTTKKIVLLACENCGWTKKETL